METFEFIERYLPIIGIFSIVYIALFLSAISQINCFKYSYEYKNWLFKFLFINLVGIPSILFSIFSICTFFIGGFVWILFCIVLTIIGAFVNYELFITYFIWSVVSLYSLWCFNHITEQPNNRKSKKQRCSTQHY